MDHADPGVQRIEGSLESDFLTLEQDGAFVPAGLVDHGHAEEDLHEGGLPCPVLPYEPDDLPGRDIEGHIHQHAIAGECLANAAQTQNWFH